MTNQFNRYKNNWVIQFLFSLLIVILTRLPYLTGPHLYFDGDEAIIGIMAQDLLQGKNIPVYFYGQQYGFSFFEVLSTAIGILVFGNTVLALKTGGMIVFSIGIFFLLRICIKKNITFWVSLCIVFAISCFPTWLLWATKPRGGYVTAFACVSAMMYILQFNKANFRSVIPVCICAAIAIHSQILILMPVSFYILVWLVSEKKIFLIFYTLSVFLLAVVVFKLPAYLNTPFWNPPLNTTLHFKHLSEIYKDLIPIINSSYFYDVIFYPNTFLVYISIIYFIIPLFIFIYILIGKSKKRLRLLLYLLLGTLLSLISIGMMHGGISRYTLGFFTGLMLMIFVIVFIYVELKEKWYRQILLMLVLVGTGCSYGIRSVPAFWQEQKKNDMVLYNGLLNKLNEHNISHVFVMDLMMQWMLSFSGVSARSTSHEERIDRFLLNVDKCNDQSGCKTALVGLVGYFQYNDSTGNWDRNKVIVNDRFFFYPNPKPQHLQAAGFK